MSIVIPECVKKYTTEEERLKMKQFFIDQLYQIDKSKKTILFSTPSETGTSHFRILEPLRALYMMYHDKYNFVYTEKLTMDLLQIADLIVQHRAGLEHTRMLDVMIKTPHRKHAKVLHDVDDNEINVSRSNPLYDMWMAAGKDKMAEYQLKNCAYITTTTDNLKAFFGRLNSKVKVVRNSFDWELDQWNMPQTWLEEKHKEGKIVIGWAGLTSHMKDIEKMMPSLKDVHDKYPNTYFVLAGMPVKNTMSQIIVDPKTGEKSFKDSEVTDPTMTYKYKVRQMYKNFDPTRIEFLDVLPLANYGEFYSKFDIGVAYTENNKFNHGKSEIKVLEYLKYKAFPLSSNVGGYSEFYKLLPAELKDPNMIVFSHENRFEWTRKLTNIVENYWEVFKPKAEKLHDFIVREYDIHKTAKERMELYESLM